MSLMSGAGTNPQDLEKLLVQATEFAEQAGARLGLLGGGNGTLTGSGIGGNENLMGLLVGAGVIFLVLVPVLKLVLTGGAALFLAGGLGKEKDGEDDEEEAITKVLKRLAGEPLDEIDGEQLKVTRLSDELAAARAAIAEQASGYAAGQALRNHARRARLRTSWIGTLDAVCLKEDERRKVDEVIALYSAKEVDRRKEHQDARKTWLKSLARNDFFLVKRWHQWGVRSTMDAQVALQDELIFGLREAMPKDAFRRLKDVFGKPNVDLRALAGDPEAAATGAAPTARLVYVLSFDGDLSASRTELLAREISAILNSKRRPSEVVLLLRSPGGTVTGYGLAGAQLMRLRTAGIRLVVCVDQLAASGGYLMACVADRIVLSPFGALGSIGVVSQSPNFAKRVNQEGFKFIQTTAGKWKTTLSPFQEPTEAELVKVKEDITMVYNTFAGWVKSNRPNIVVEEVATGEVWYGPRALEKGLADELQTSAEYLLRLMQEPDCEVLQLSFERKKEGGGLAGLLGEAVRSAAASPAAAAALQGALAELLAGNAGNTAGAAALKELLRQAGVDAGSLGGAALTASAAAGGGGGLWPAAWR